MIKIRLSIIIIFLTFSVFGQTKTERINGHDFYFKTILIDNENGGPVKQVEVYRNDTKLLTHILSRIEGDCNSESVELGNVEIRDSVIIFYTYWARAGDAPVSPFGGRKQEYTVNKNGKLILTQSGLYIETSREGWPENQGMEYLFSEPKNEKEQQLLNEYIKGAELAYNATFVKDKASSLLLNEVRKKLKDEISAATKDWEKLYAGKIGGYKK